MRNDELGAGINFLFKFVILEHLLRFGRLEGRNNSTSKKIAGLVTDFTFDARILQAPVHVRYQLQCMDRIQIKDRGRSPLITGYRIIAAHNQKVSDPCPIQCIKLAFDLTAVLVFTGKMNEGLDAQFQNFAAHEIGGHGRGSSRIVCNGEGLNLLPTSGLFGISQGLFLGRFSCAPSRHQFPCDRKRGGIQ